MRVKTFEAASMQEALAVVKRDMGEEAFILSTRTKRRKTPLGEETYIEVTAAVDEATAPVAANGTYGLRQPLAARAPEPRPPVHVHLPVPEPSAPKAPPMDLQPLRRELLEIKGAVEALKDVENRNASILQQLDLMKAQLTRIQKQGMPQSQLQLPQTLLELYGDLVANDVDPFIALRLCEYTQRSLMEQDGDYVLMEDGTECAHEGVDPFSRRALDKLMMDAATAAIKELRA